MSLTDALLLDPHRDPREIWLVAARSDGQRGDGTQADPYNCSSQPHKAFTVSPLSFDESTGKAMARTTAPHGFRTGDLVTIGGVDIQLANLNDNHYVGTFEIEYKCPNTFSYPRQGTLPGTPASVTAPVPSEGTIQCWRERELFDVVMRNAPENCVIHLGVGEFETKGASGYPGGWTAKSGQRFLGAGMGLTTLKLVNAAGVGWKKYAAILAPSVSGFEVADLTVDCAVDEQLSSFTNCAAIAVVPVMAHHVRIRRVRVIRFGSNGPLGTLGPPDNAYSENFPIFVSCRDVLDVVYEDCVAEQPGPNVAWNSVILNLGGGYEAGTVYYGRGLAVRNNYVNGQLIYGPRAYVQSLSVDPYNVNLVTLTTKRPHGYKVPGIVSVQGVKVNGSTNNRFNGVFKVDAPAGTDTDTELRYTVFAADEDNLKEVDGEPTVDADTIIGAPVSPHFLLMKISVAQDNQTFTVKSWVPYEPPDGQYAPHNLTVNSKIRVSGVTLNGIDPNPPHSSKSLGPDSPDNPCNGLFQVTEVISKTEFKFLAAQPINTQIIAPSYTFTGDMAIGMGHSFIGVGICTGGVVEGNRLLHGDKGGPWNDTASTLDIVARNNYYHDINVGAYRNMGHEISEKAATSLTRDGLVATCNVGKQEHGLVVGQVVHITNTHIGGLDEPLTDQRFNGYHIVTNVGVTPEPDGTRFFEYLMNKEPQANADTLPDENLPKFLPVSQDASLILENNVVELAFGRLQGYWSNPSGIQFGIDKESLFEQIPYTFRQVLLRENVIRQVDGKADFSHFGIIVRASEKLRADNNVIDVGGGGVRFNKCVSPIFSNNLSTAGKVLRGYDEATGESQSELATRVEDALILSL